MWGDCHAACSAALGWRVLPACCVAARLSNCPAPPPHTHPTPGSPPPRACNARSDLDDDQQLEDSDDLDGGSSGRRSGSQRSGGGGGARNRRGGYNGKSEKELLLLDPKRVKRILANRESAARSKVGVRVVVVAVVATRAVCACVCIWCDDASHGGGVGAQGWGLQSLLLLCLTAARRRTAVCCPAARTPLGPPMLRAGAPHQPRNDARGCTAEPGR